MKLAVNGKLYLIMLIAMIKNRLFDYIILAVHAIVYVIRHNQTGNANIFISFTMSSSLQI